MNIVDSTVVNVYNYSPSPISVATHINPAGYWFEGSLDGEEPVIVPITFAEIRVVNGQSQVFREGRLRFEPTIEQDVYETLRIRDWENILSNDEIKDIILNPTKEKLEKIVKITSMSLMDRVRGILAGIKNDNSYDIVERVVDVINARYKELYAGRRKSEIEIYKTKQEMIEETKKDIIASEIDKIKADLEAKIRAELEEKIKKELEGSKKTKTNKSTKLEE